MTAAGSGQRSVRGRGRQLLLDAAREQFAQRGFKGASTRDIAERAGVSEVTIFRHFGSKSNLFQEAVVEPFTTFVKHYISDYRARQHGALTAEEEGNAFYSGLSAVLRSEREVLLAMMAARQFDDLPREAFVEVDAAFAEVLAIVEELVVTESTNRGFTDFDLAATVRIILSMTLGAALHGDLMGMGSVVTYERMAEAMTRFSIRGLQVPTGL